VTDQTTGGLVGLYLAGVIVLTDVVMVDQPVYPLHNGKLWSWKPEQKEEHF